MHVTVQGIWIVTDTQSEYGRAKHEDGDKERMVMRSMRMDTESESGRGDHPDGCGQKERGAER